jgi:hypothetical protein
MEVDPQEVHDEALRQIGALTVEVEFLRRQINRVEAERDEAGARIVALLGESESEPESGEPA